MLFAKIAVSLLAFSFRQDRRAFLEKSLLPLKTSSWCDAYVPLYKIAFLMSSQNHRDCRLHSSQQMLETMTPVRIPFQGRRVRAMTRNWRWDRSLLRWIDCREAARSTTMFDSRCLAITNRWTITQATLFHPKGRTCVEDISRKRGTIQLAKRSWVSRGGCRFGSEPSLALQVARGMFSKLLPKMCRTWSLSMNDITRDRLAQKSSFSTMKGDLIFKVFANEAKYLPRDEEDLQVDFV